LANKASKEYEAYFSTLKESLNSIYEISSKAREQGLDPKRSPETEIASDLAGLVEGFMALPGLSTRIRELSKTMSRENVAFKIAEDIIYGKFGRRNEEEAAGLAIRAALAILTEGVTAAVYSEGIADVSIKSNLDGSRYLAICFAGPIRSAGGTETALTPVIADFVRKHLGLDIYKPTEEEIRRFIEELRLYEREVGRFQYRVSDEQLTKALQYLPVEITGTPSDRIEVSSFRNLPRIETNSLRGGALRVVNDGVVGRSAKVLAVVDELGIQGWDWLRDIRDVVAKRQSGFMEDVPAGRPILCFPSRRGGFRLRYGRSRNSGLAAVAVHPLTMEILQNFLAGGTQLKIETPGKSGVVVPVEALEPPIVRLKGGDVIQVSHENIGQLKDRIDKILFLGDLLVSFGDFLYNSKGLLPAGYAEEWWVQELQRAIMNQYNSDLDAAAAKTLIPTDLLKAYLANPFKSKPEIEKAIRLSTVLKIPLHPRYTFIWTSVTAQDLQKLRSWLFSAKIKRENNKVCEVRGPVKAEIKNLLEKICIPHKNIRQEITIEGDEALAFSFSLGLHLPNRRVTGDKTTLENLSRLSGILFRDKAPTFIGARVGRPEKAKRREMKPVVQVLFPVGLRGGAKRDLIKACEGGMLQVEIVKRTCAVCKTSTFTCLCPNCGSETKLEIVCPRCGRSLQGSICPVCKVEGKNFERQIIPLQDMINKARDKVGFTPKQIKGVKGLSNRTKTPEIIEKGILRAKYGLSVYKDGTVRFDATNAPLTHFKPSETGISLERLRELGYYYDSLGSSLISRDQVCELKIQDVIIPQRSANYLIRTASFIDDLLEKVYALPRYYNVNRPEDLIGHLIIGLAPHTCAGTLGRIIGFTKLRVCLAHPFWHSAKRRDCDGDEDSIMLALDPFLNFSRKYLPNRIGGIMDSPLFVIRAIDPQEVQRQAHELDVAANYPLEFYENTFQKVSSRDVMGLIDTIKNRFGSEAEFQGFSYTIPTSDINAGNNESVYKTLKKMTDKLDAQLKLAEKIDAVDAFTVAEIVLNSHFFRDISGNLRAFTTQSFRCKKCNKRFRRIPLKGKCTECGGELTLTVYRGGIEKYLKAARRLVKKYEMSEYYAQRLALIEDEISSIFESGETTKQTPLSRFISS
jgi:DNA polymerase II large subunit